MTFDALRVRELLRRYAWNATAYQIVNPGIEHWFSARGDAVIGYMRRPRVRVVAGAPVCAEARLPEVLEEWNRHLTRHGERACYFGAADRLKTLLAEDPAYCIVMVGAQPVWDPRAWPPPSRMRPSLRAQLRRARNKGVVIREWDVSTARNHPALLRVLDQWLARKPLPSLHFLVEPRTLAALEEKRMFVAEREGVPVGFLNAAPIPTRAGWLTEQCVRGEDAPNGTAELMMDAAARAVAVEGAAYFTMGLVPLAGRHRAPGVKNPLWLRAVFAWVRAHGRRFYHFEGLEAFKAKFGPDAWEPLYLIAQEPRVSPETLCAVAAVFSDRSPVSLIARGLVRAAGQEVRRLRPAR